MRTCVQQQSVPRDYDDDAVINQKQPCAWPDRPCAVLLWVVHSTQLILVNIQVGVGV